jgi:hypothetical protein
MIPKVQTMLMTTKVQNSQLARVVTSVPHVAAAAE